MRRLLPLLMMVSAITTSTAQAQTRRPLQPQPRPMPLPPASLRAVAMPKFRLSLNGGAQIGTSTATQDFAVVINQDDASIVNDIDLAGGGFVDAGLAYKVGNSLWAGVALSLHTGTVESQLSARVPHPFYFTYRDVEGTITDLKHMEAGIHVTLGYEKLLSPRLSLLLSGGPSVFNITQDMVTDIQYDSTYPFDTATLASATTVSTSGLAFGFNAGADISYALTPAVWLGGLARFSKATGTLEAAPDNTAEISAGGLMVGGGLRFTF